MSHTYINGQGGSITLGATSLDVESFSITVACEVLDTTNTGDSGWQSNINGIKSVEGSVKTFFDSATDPVPTFYEGGTGTLTLPLGSSGKQFSGSCRISKITAENPAKGVVTFGFDFVSNGSWTLPT